MGEETGKPGFDANIHTRRSTVMTAVVDLTLVSTTALLLKKYVDIGAKQNHHALLVTMTALLLVVLIAMLVLAFFVFGPKIEFLQVHAKRVKELRRQIERFRREVRKKTVNPLLRGMHDKTILKLFVEPTWKVLNSDNVVIEIDVKKYYHDVIEHYKKHFPEDVKDKTDVDIWAELKDKFREFKASRPEKEHIKKVKDTDTLNDILSGLSAIVLALMIIINTFDGSSPFGAFTN